MTRTQPSLLAHVEDQSKTAPPYRGTSAPSAPRGYTKFQTDPHWRDLILFYEYFNGDNGAGVGANHQTGWTGLVATLIRDCAQMAEAKRSQGQSSVVSLDRELIAS